MWGYTKKRPISLRRKLKGNAKVFLLKLALVVPQQFKGRFFDVTI
jgi:hypothetical protein